MSAEWLRVVVEKTVCCLRCKVMLLSNDRMGDVSEGGHGIAAHVPAMRPRSPAATMRCVDDVLSHSRLRLAVALNLSMGLFSLALLGKAARTPMQASRGQAKNSEAICRCGLSRFNGRYRKSRRLDNHRFIGRPNSISIRLFDRHYFVRIANKIECESLTWCYQKRHQSVKR